jgi:hypothetical protein
MSREGHAGRGKEELAGAAEIAVKSTSLKDKGEESPGTSVEPCCAQPPSRKETLTPEERRERWTPGSEGAMVWGWWGWLWRQGGWRGVEEAGETRGVPSRTRSFGAPFIKDRPNYYKAMARDK